MSAKNGSRLASPAIKGKIISRSRSTKPALTSCQARVRLPMVRKGTSLSALHLPDLIDKILTTDPRVGPDRLLQGPGEHNLVQLIHPFPGLVAALALEPRQSFVGSPPHDHELRCIDLGRDPFLKLWAQIAEVSR